MVKVDLAADADGLVAGVTSAVVEIVAIADVAFDDDYTVVFVLFFLIWISYIETNITKMLQSPGALNIKVDTWE